MRLLYTLFIQIYTFSITCYAAVNDKANLWINGRKDWKKKLQSFNFKGHDIYWFHCASLGEFEQGRPLMETIKADEKNKILLTFFSPSGYELRKNYKMADWVLYLPADLPKNAEFFINAVNPKAVFFIKYEFWFNYLFELKKRAIPVFLVSGIFRESQYFFHWYGAWARKQLGAFSCFFLQNQKSLELLNNVGFKNAIVTGDTRFDRVLQIMKERKRMELLDVFVKNTMVTVAGSTYVEDEKLLKKANNFLEKSHLKVKFIIAPHVVTQNRIREIEGIFGIDQCVRFSIMKAEDMHKKVLIIDNIGMLSSLYGHATLAYIGGGLGKGIHNTLEAAVYGIPLIFGNKYHKFDEAKALIETGAAFVVTNEVALNNKLLSLFSDEKLRKSIGLKSSNYVTEQKGSLAKIIDELKMRNIL